MWANEVDALEKTRAQLEVCHSSQPHAGHMVSLPPCALAVGFCWTHVDPLHNSHVRSGCLKARPNHLVEIRSTTSRRAGGGGRLSGRDASAVHRRSQVYPNTTSVAADTLGCAHAPLGAPLTYLPSLHQAHEEARRVEQERLNKAAQLDRVAALDALLQHADLSKNGTRFTTVATLQLAYGWPVVWVSGLSQSRVVL